MVSPDSRLGTVGIYIQYITKIVVLVSEPVRGRSRATELPCFPEYIHNKMNTNKEVTVTFTSRHIQMKTNMDMYLV